MDFKISKKACRVCLYDDGIVPLGENINEISLEHMIKEISNTAVKSRS